MHQTAITAEADGQRITATATEGRGIILNASKVGSISLQIDVHVDGAELRDLLEQITGAARSQSNRPARPSQRSKPPPSPTRATTTEAPCKPRPSPAPTAPPSP